jgi:hypothetical protein
VRHQASGNYTQRPRNSRQLEPGNQKQAESDCDQIFIECKKCDTTSLCDVKLSEDKVRR